MKIRILIILCAFSFMAMLSCKNVPADPAPVYIRAGYQVYAFSSPCGPGGTYIESQTNANGVYTLHNYCAGGSYGNTQNSSAAVFKMRTYADDYMAATTDGGAFSVTTTPSAAPAETTICYRCSDGSHLVCRNSTGVITYMDEHPSVHGVVDADGSAKLIFYDEQSAPF